MLNKVRCEFEIIELKDKKVFALGSKNKGEEITFYDKDLMEKAINSYFNKKYRDLLYIIMSIENADDATESDTELVLMKIDDLRNYVLKMFGKHLDAATLKRYMNMLLMLESKVPTMERKSKGR